MQNYSANQSPTRAMMQSLPASNKDYSTASRNENSGSKAYKLNPLLVSLTVNSVGSNSPREEKGKQLSDYLSNLPRIAPQKDISSSGRRNDVLSKSMAISSRHSDAHSSTFQVLGTSMTSGRNQRNHRGASSIEIKDIIASGEKCA